MATDASSRTSRDCIPSRDCIRAGLSSARPAPHPGHATAPGEGVNAVDWGSLRRLVPVSRVFGFDRGLCIDRYYIERFLERHASDIQGRTLEVAEDTYTRRFGGDRVRRRDILHVDPSFRRATLTADLTRPDSLPAGAFDCIVCTQTLPFIYDIRAAVGSLRRMLRPGGVVLATFAGISQISRYDADRWGDFWRLTSQSAGRLFGDVFGPAHLEVSAYGNVLAAVAFLHGLAADELTREELDHPDGDYELLLTVRAVKAGSDLAAGPESFVGDGDGI